MRSLEPPARCSSDLEVAKEVLPSPPFHRHADDLCRMLSGFRPQVLSHQCWFSLNWSVKWGTGVRVEAVSNVAGSCSSLLPRHWLSEPTTYLTYYASDHASVHLDPCISGKEPLKLLACLCRDWWHSLHLICTVDFSWSQVCSSLDIGLQFVRRRTQSFCFSTITDVSGEWWKYYLLSLRREMVFLFLCVFRVNPVVLVFFLNLGG